LGVEPSSESERWRTSFLNKLMADPKSAILDWDESRQAHGYLNDLDLEHVRHVFRDALQNIAVVLAVEGGGAASKKPATAIIRSQEELPPSVNFIVVVTDVVPASAIVDGQQRAGTASGSGANRVWTFDLPLQSHRAAVSVWPIMHVGGIALKPAKPVAMGREGYRHRISADWERTGWLRKRAIVLRVDSVGSVQLSPIRIFCRLPEPDAAEVIVADITSAQLEASKGGQKIPIVLASTYPWMQIKNQVDQTRFRIELLGEGSEKWIQIQCDPMRFDSDL